MVAGDLNIQAQKTDWILGEGDGSTTEVEMWILQLSSGTLQRDTLALGHLCSHPRPVQPVPHLWQQVLAAGWGVGHKTCVICILQDIDTADGAWKLVYTQGRSLWRWCQRECSSPCWRWLPTQCRLGTPPSIERREESPNSLWWLWPRDHCRERGEWRGTGAGHGSVGGKTGSVSGGHYHRH